MRLSPLLCLVAAICAFGSVPVFIRYFVGLIDAWTVNGVRYAIAACCWLPYLLVVRRRAGLPAGLWRAAMVPAAFNLIGQVLWGLSPYFNSAPVNAFAVRTGFLFTIAWSFLLLPDERRLVRRPSFWVGTVGSVVGVLLLFWQNGSLPMSISMTGAIVILTCSIFFGGYGVVVRRCMAAYPVRLSFAVVSLYTAGGLLLLMVCIGDYGAVAGIGGGNWVLLVLSAVIGIGVAHVVLYHAVHSIGPVATNGGLNLAPFVSYLLAALFLHERMISAQWGGGLCLVAGVTVLLYAKAVPIGRCLDKSSGCDLLID